MMRFFIYCSGIFFLLLTVLSACTKKNIQCANREVYLQQLSAEIENPLQNNSPIIQEKEKIFSSEYKDVSEGKNSVSNSDKIITIKKPGVFKIKETPAGNIKKAGKPKTSEVDKDNIFWKIGAILLKIGSIVLSIFGGVFISANRNGGGVFIFSGAIIGLAIIILGLLFFLLALISTHVKKRNASKPPVENEDEI